MVGKSGPRERPINREGDVQSQIHDSIVESLYEGRRDHRTPAELQEARLDKLDGLGLQLEVLRRFEQDGLALAGWKVGLTSGQGRDSMGQDFRPFGYVLSNRALESPASIARLSVLNGQIEPELCLVLGRPLRGQVTRDEVRAAVRGVAPAFEINEIRMSREWGEGMVLADGLFNWGIVVGPESPPQDDLVTTTVRLFQGDTQLAETTPGPAMDDPYLSVSRLCQLLDRFDLGLDAGLPIITGSFCHQRISEAGTFRAVFQGIGEVSVTFTDHAPL
jgi:2-keto-4-pentenoate hydratase